MKRIIAEEGKCYFCGKYGCDAYDRKKGFVHIQCVKANLKFQNKQARSLAYLLEQNSYGFSITSYSKDANGRILNEIDDEVQDPEVEEAFKRMEKIKLDPSQIVPEPDDLWDSLYRGALKTRCVYCGKLGCDSWNDLKDEFVHVKCAKRVLKGTFKNSRIRDYNKQKRFKMIKSGRL